MIVWFVGALIGMWCVYLCHSPLFCSSVMIFCHDHNDWLVPSSLPGADPVPSTTYLLLSPVINHRQSIHLQYCTLYISIRPSYLPLPPPFPSFLSFLFSPPIPISKCNSHSILILIMILNLIVTATAIMKVWKMCRWWQGKKWTPMMPIWCFWTVSL